jgi:hypothetical protein
MKEAGICPASFFYLIDLGSDIFKNKPRSGEILITPGATRG